VGFYVAVALALGLHRLAADRHGLVPLATTALSAATIVVTLTRSALLSGLVVVIGTAAVAAARGRPGRVRLALLVALAGLLVAPVATSSTVAQRTVASFNGQQDVQDHVSAADAGFAAIADQPLGRGLGTAPGIGDRFDVQGKVTSEDAYLQVGTELSVGTMAVFVALYALLLVRLRRVKTEAAPAASAMYAAGLGLAVGGLFLHVWLDFSTALTFWGLAGLALAPAPQADGSECA
jgi:hypothetical protein